MVGVGPNHECSIIRNPDRPTHARSTKKQLKVYYFPDSNRAGFPNWASSQGSRIEPAPTLVILYN